MMNWIVNHKTSIFVRQTIHRLLFASYNEEILYIYDNLNLRNKLRKFSWILQKKYTNFIRNPNTKQNNAIFFQMIIPHSLAVYQETIGPDSTWFSLNFYKRKLNRPGLLSYKNNRVIEHVYTEEKTVEFWAHRRKIRCCCYCSCCSTLDVTRENAWLNPTAIREYRVSGTTRLSGGSSRFRLRFAEVDARSAWVESYGRGFLFRGCLRAEFL